MWPHLLPIAPGPNRKEEQGSVGASTRDQRLKKSLASHSCWVTSRKAMFTHRFQGTRAPHTRIEHSPASPKEEAVGHPLLSSRRRIPRFYTSSGIRMQTCSTLSSLDTAASRSDLKAQVCATVHKKCLTLRFAQAEWPQMLVTGSTKIWPTKEKAALLSTMVPPTLTSIAGL